MDGCFQKGLDLKTGVLFFGVWFLRSGKKRAVESAGPALVVFKDMGVNKKLTVWFFFWIWTGFCAFRCSSASGTKLHPQRGPGNGTNTLFYHYGIY